MSYVVAVPSYQRPVWLTERTLTTLLNGGVPMERVHVFVHDNDPYLDSYRDVAAANGVHLEVTGARGIREQRQCIINRFPAGQHIVSMDDDIQAVQYAVTGQKTLQDVANLDKLFQGMFQECEQRGLNVWGVAPVNNPFFMNPGQLYEGLKLVMFTLYGFINRPGHPVHEPTVEYKDEQELTLRAYWWDGAILRHDGVAVKANYYGPGGCTAAGRDYRAVRESQDALLAQWPGYAYEVQKKTGWPEMRLVSKKRHAGNPLDVPPPGVTAPHAG